MWRLASPSRNPSWLTLGPPLFADRHPETLHGKAEHTESLRTLIYDKSKVDDATWAAYADSQIKKLPSDMAILSWHPEQEKRKPLPK